MYWHVALYHVFFTLEGTFHVFLRVGPPRRALYHVLPSAGESRGQLLLRFLFLRTWRHKAVKLWGLQLHQQVKLHTILTCLRVLSPDRKWQMDCINVPPSLQAHQLYSTGHIQTILHWWQRAISNQSDISVFSCSEIDGRSQWWEYGSQYLAQGHVSSYDQLCLLSPVKKQLLFWFVVCSSVQHTWPFLLRYWIQNACKNNEYSTRWGNVVWT